MNVPGLPQLTDRQAAILKFIAERIDEDRCPPTVREIAGSFGIRSPKAVSDHLAALEKKGYITRGRGVSRGIELNDALLCEEGIPLLGAVAAGQPVLAEENFDGYLQMGELFENDGSLFALQVWGDSMIEAGICDGDYVVVKHQPGIDNGDIGVAIVGNEATVKRIYDEGDRFRLHPENSSMRDILVSDCDPEFRIGGKVIGVVRKLS